MSANKIVIMIVVVGIAYWAYMNVGTPDIDVDVDPLAKAESFHQTAQYGKALPLYEQLLSENPEHEQREKIVYRIAHCYEKTQQYGKAADQYDAYLKEYPRGEYAQSAKENFDRTNLQR